MKRAPRQEHEGASPQEPPGHRGAASASPESAATLEDQLARLKFALATGESQASLPDLVNPRPQDLAWDLHLISGLAKIAHPDIPPLLAARFGEAPGQGPLKALKRALHVLKTLGVQVPAGLFSRGTSGPAAPPGSRPPGPGVLHFRERRALLHWKAPGKSWGGTSWWPA